MPFLKVKVKQLFSTEAQVCCGMMCWDGNMRYSTTYLNCLLWNPTSPVLWWSGSPTWLVLNSIWAMCGGKMWYSITDSVYYETLLLWFSGGQVPQPDQFSIPSEINCVSLLVATNCKFGKLWASDVNKLLYKLWASDVNKLLYKLWASDENKLLSKLWVSQHWIRWKHIALPPPQNFRHHSSWFDTVQSVSVSWL